jgi:hypothetical protein
MNTWGRDRSQRAVHGPSRERLEHVLDDVLGGEPLDQLGLLQSDRSLVGHGAQQLGVLLVERALVRHAAQEAELLVARRERRDQEVVLHRAGAPAAHERHQLAGTCRASGSLGWIRACQVELVGLGVDAPDLARLGAEQLARAARDRVVEVLAQRDRRQRLAQLRERRERLDPAARALV